MFCSKCGNIINDDVAVCPHCGTATNTYQPVSQQPPVQPNYQQPPVQPNYQQPDQPVYQQVTVQPGFQQVPPQAYNPQAAQFNNDVSTAKTLGIVAIIAGIFIPLAGWICGGIGLSKAKHCLAMNPASYEAQNAKKLNIAGLIVTSVLYALIILFYIIIFAFSMATVY